MSSTEEPSSLVRLEDVTYGYPGGPIVLGKFSFDIKEGEIVAVVGPSGCGKTTLLSLLAGLVQPREGRIEWSEDRVVPPRHPLTMMFQKDTVLPWLTAESNVGLHFQLTKSRIKKAERKRRVAELIKLAGLTGAEEKFSYQLSGGMRRRVAFLAAVAPRPRTLLLDEPFSALDEPTRIAIHSDIFKIVKAEGISVLLVTHDIGEAISLADRIVVLTSRPGRIFEIHKVPFGVDRDILRLREQPEFLSLYGKLWEQLEEQVHSSRPAEQVDLDGSKEVTR